MIEIIVIGLSPPFSYLLSTHRIMGLYVSVVLVIGKFVRGFFSEVSHSIMFEELPCVDHILKLCTDIFLVSVTCTYSIKTLVFTLILSSHILEILNIP